MSAIGGDNIDLQLQIKNFPTTEESDLFPVTIVAQQESPGRSGDCSLVSTPLHRVENCDQEVTDGNIHSESPPSEGSTTVDPRGTDIYRPDAEQIRRLESQSNDREFAATMMDDVDSRDRHHVATYRPTLNPALGGNQTLVAVEEFTDDLKGYRDREETLRESSGRQQFPIPRPRPSTLIEKDGTAGVDKFRRERDRGDGKTRSSPNNN